MKSQSQSTLRRIKQWQTVGENDFELVHTDLLDESQYEL
jgi:hypothetical protein